MNCIAVPGPVPDVLTLRPASIDQEADEGLSGSPVATAPPRTRIVRQAEERIYVRKADRIAVRHRHGTVVAVVEIEVMAASKTAASSGCAAR